MRFMQTPLAGTWVIELELVTDERGSFARTFDAHEFRERGMDPAVLQCNTSFNARAGTLRGMHFQADPYAEPKLVRCVRGSIFDVALDLRPESPTYCRWHGVELSADNGRMLFVPRGFAHGYQTLVDDCEILYQMGERYVPDAARGIRWDDPTFAIEWPTAARDRVISDRDRSYADFER
jgi:dTDP-4-dehydrorhamnose 3,5-epimerase